MNIGLNRFARSRQLLELEADRAFWLAAKLNAITVGDLERAAMMLAEIDKQIREGVRDG